MTEIWLCVMALIVGAMVFLAYRQGLHDGRAVKDERPLQPLFALPGKGEAEAELSEEEKLLQWAESYEG